MFYPPLKGDKDVDTWSSLVTDTEEARKRIKYKGNIRCKYAYINMKFKRVKICYNDRWHFVLFHNHLKYDVFTYIAGNMEIFLTQLLACTSRLSCYYKYKDAQDFS